MKDYIPKINKPLRPGATDYLECRSVEMGAHSGTARSTSRYTGDQLLGIATMHKSNAVPIVKGSDMAEATAKMRRG